MKLRPNTIAAPTRYSAPTDWQGLHQYETHKVPIGAVILDAKYCEFCGCNFLRRTQSQDRYCFNCLLNIVTVDRREAEWLVPELMQSVRDPSTVSESCP
jgi:hypothetical protein